MAGEYSKGLGIFLFSSLIVFFTLFIIFGRPKKRKLPNLGSSDCPIINNIVGQYINQYGSMTSKTININANSSIILPREEDVISYLFTENSNYYRLISSSFGRLIPLITVDKYINLGNLPIVLTPNYRWDLQNMSSTPDKITIYSYILTNEGRNMLIQDSEDYPCWEDPNGFTFKLY